MTVRVYTSTDASAPVLNESSGSLINVLDACLVNGYGSKVSSGWAKAFSNSTTGAAYRAPVGNRHYLSVDDSGGAYPRVHVVGNATDWNVGEWVSPSDALIPGGLYLPKHNNIAGPRTWWVVASDKFVFMWTQWSSAVDSSAGACWYFGDVKAARINDAYASILVGAAFVVDSNHWPGSWTTSPSAATCVASHCAISESPFVATPGGWQYQHGKVWARSYSGIGPGVPATTQHDLSRFEQGIFSNNNVYNINGGTCTYGCYYYNYPIAGNPNPIDNSVYFSPVTASEGFYYRGTVPGVWVPMFTSGTQYHGTKVVGNGEYAGKEFLLLQTPWGVVAIETSDTW
jgi:hypothetical protein